jgi:hypothetical protein
MNAAAETCINNPVLRHLAEAVLFSASIDDSIDEASTICDFDEQCLAALYSDFQQFIDKCEAEITALLGSGWNSLEDFYFGCHPDGCVERDFINTRNRDGAGFWDSGRWDKSVSSVLVASAHQFKQIECYTGDDDKIYFI